MNALLFNEMKATINKECIDIKDDKEATKQNIHEIKNNIR